MPSNGSTTFDKNAPQEHIRGILGRLAFHRRGGALKPVDRAFRRRVRAPLARQAACSSSTTCSILDEPTNHLDIESIEGLLEGIERCSKVQLSFVSHDRHFVSKLATRIVELRPKAEGHGAEIVDYGGTYDEFLEKAGTDYIRKN